MGHADRTTLDLVRANSCTAQLYGGTVGPADPTTLGYVRAVIFAAQLALLSVATSLNLGQLIQRVVAGRVLVPTMVVDSEPNELAAVRVRLLATTGTRLIHKLSKLVAALSAS